jgi:hypothetical protein
MSAGVEAVSVRPLELCLWVGVVEVSAGMRGGGAGYGRMAGAAPVKARHPTRAANGERVRAGMLPRMEDDSVSLGPPYLSRHDHRRGRSAANIRRTRPMVSRWDWTRGVKYRPDFYTDFYDENCKRYVIAEPVH